MPSSETASTEMKIVEREALGIPGLKLLGHCRFFRATEPLAPHTHGSCYEFICLIKGEDVYCASGLAYRLHGGEVFVSYPGEEHFSGEAHQGVGEYVWFQIDASSRKNLLGLSEENADALCRSLSLMKRHLFPASPEISSLAMRLWQAVSGGSDRLFCTGLLLSLLSLLLHGGGGERRIDPRIEAVLRHIGGHPDCCFPAGELSGVADMSESAFKHLFRRETGDTPRDYVNRLRIAHARALLDAGMSVTRAAIESGFASAGYFAAVFKKYTFETPSAYARRRRGS